jgi:hypothetical protein
VNDDELDGRVSTALDDLATDVPETAPPVLSWQQPGRAVPPAGRRRRSGRVARVAAPLTAAAAVAAVVATLLAGSGPEQVVPVAVPAATPSTSAPTTSTPAAPPVDVTGRTAPELLVAAAETALGTAEPAPGQFRYVRIQTPDQGVDDNGTFVPPAAGAYDLDEYWIPADPQDPDTPWLRRMSSVGVPPPFDFPAYEWSGICGDLYKGTIDGGVGRTPDDDPCARPAGLDDPSPAFVAGLPRDADQLSALVEQQARADLNPDKVHDVDAMTVRIVQSLLDSNMASTDLTATLYQVLSRVPGIEVVPDLVTASGLTGTGFRITYVAGPDPVAGRTTETVVIDLATGTYLGYGGDSLRTVGIADELGVAPS